jgi:hypothetical protein
MEQAHHELDRLQAIITRHEGHMFALRGWLLTVLGGLLAAYYTGNIAITEMAIRIGLPVVALMFLFVESRHENLVEAVTERAKRLEKRIVAARRSGQPPAPGWYDGPQVSKACLAGARRRWPRAGMTFILYRPFYLVVIFIVFVIVAALPGR